MARDWFETSKRLNTSSNGSLPFANKIIGLLRKAVSATTSPIPDRLNSAMRWIVIANEIEPNSALEAYRAAFTHLGSAVTLGQSLHERHSDFLSRGARSRPATGLALEAALWALAGTNVNPKLAIELLDQGRNVLLASVGRFRAELSDVRQKDPALADEFYRTSRVLDSAILTGQEISQRKSLHEDRVSRYQRVSADWEAVVANIRRLPGCEFFLLPVPYIELREAAVVGPVIVILVGKERSKAIIVTENEEPHIIELPNASEEALKALYEELKDAVGTLSTLRMD